MWKDRREVLIIVIIMYMVVKDKKNAYDCIGSEHRKNGFSLFQEKGKLCMIAWYVLYHIPFHLLKISLHQFSHHHVHGS